MKTSVRFTLLALALGLNGMLFAQSAAPSSPPVVNPVMPAVVAASPAPAQDAAPVPGGGILTFEEDHHDFGEMQQGGDASWVFKFRNTGTEDILISVVKPQCGCTHPEWPKVAIKPGQIGEIPVKYDSNRLGGFDKFSTIISNASETEKKIYIKGNILAAPSAPDLSAPIEGPRVTPAPANSGH